MQKRASHKKSRQGCACCKKNHLKCDEQHPSCANCTVRGLECTYPGRGFGPRTTAARRRPTSRNKIKGDIVETPATSRGLLGSISSSSSTSKTTATTTANSSSSPTSLVSAPRSPSPACFSNSPTSDRLLELELMHRWSIRSWAGFNAVPCCEVVLKTAFPRDALKYDFLLNGIFSVAAADAAMQISTASPARSRYGRAALEYANKSSEQFRDKLAAAGPQDVHLLYYFAILSTVLNFVIPGRYTSALQRLDISLKLFLGSFRGAGKSDGDDGDDSSMPDWVARSPNSLAVALEHMPKSPELVALLPLDDDTRVAVERMTSLSQVVRVPASDHAGSGPGSLACHVEAYRDAIEQLRYCFAYDLEDPSKGFFLTMVAAGGREFADAVQSREPVALFVLMYWAVLMDRAGNQGSMWWVGRLGRHLVSEISGFLRVSHIGHMEDVREGILWARSQVSLTPSFQRQAAQLPLHGAMECSAIVAG